MVVDYLIAGQGIAGTLASWFLYRKGRKFVVIDRGSEGSSSSIAAGIFIPITGRRIVPTWKAGVLIPFADSTYRAMETELGEKIFYPKPILKVFSSHQEHNDWLSRSADAAMAEYITGPPKEDINTPFGSAGIREGGYVEMRKLIRLWRKKLKEMNALAEEPFDYSSLELSEGRVVYKGIKTANVIFCEGWAVSRNPFFHWLPMTPSKGEMITFHADMKLNSIITAGIFVLPSGENTFKAGSTFTWDDLTDIPTAEARASLSSGVLELTGRAPGIIAHEAAVRPTVRDRRPLVGRHPVYPQLSVLNGMGTKGVLLAPWTASRLISHLEEGIPLEKEISISRFAYQKEPYGIGN